MVDIREVGSISDRTLNPEHLVVAFLTALRVYAPERAGHFRNTGSLGFLNLDEKVDRLISELEDIAPDGYYFGTHPDNGSDFGFWPIELEEGYL